MPSTYSATSTTLDTELSLSRSGSNGCGCDDDYSHQTANTGIETTNDISANPNLTLVLSDTGSYVTVFTAASPDNANGSTINSIIIKAQQATVQGMLRLFISNGTTAILYKEIPIPVVPMAATTPVPAPQYIMYETILLGGLKLNPGYSLLATTQNAQNFSIIVEGLDWVYPETISLCCNLEQDAANTGIGSPAYNTALDGSGTVATIFQAGATLGTSDANGSLIKNITIKALQNTQEGAVRLFVSPTGDADSWVLMQEVYIPESVPSAYEPSYKQVITANFNLQSGYYIGATTQNNEAYAITVEAEDWIYPS